MLKKHEKITLFTGRICLTFLIVLISSCNVYQDTQVYQTKEIEFSKYKTYAWLPSTDLNGNDIYADDFIQKVIRNYFAHCMNQRTLKLDTLQPDLLLKVEWFNYPKVAFVPNTDVKPGFYNPIYYDGSRSIYFSGDNLNGTNWSEEQDSKEVRVDFVHGGVKLTAIDRANNKIVWYGMAEGDLYDKYSMHRDLHPAIHKLMKQFPTAALDQ